MGKQGCISHRSRLLTDAHDKRSYGPSTAICHGCNKRQPGCHDRIEELMVHEPYPHHRYGEAKSKTKRILTKRRCKNVVDGSLPSKTSPFDAAISRSPSLVPRDLEVKTSTSSIRKPTSVSNFRKPTLMHLIPSIHHIRANG